METIQEQQVRKDHEKKCVRGEHAKEDSSDFVLLVRGMPDGRYAASASVCKFCKCVYVEDSGTQQPKRNQKG